MKKFKTFFNGSNVLLIGTKHKRITNKREFEPMNQEEYHVIANFNPTAIFVELLGSHNIKSKAKHKSDISAINKYIENNNGVDLIKHDTDVNKSRLEYAIEKPEGIDKKYDEETDSRRRYREVLHDNYLEMFEDMYAQREEKSVLIFVKKITNYNRVVVHCGLKHFEVYKQFFEFMK